MRAVDHDLDTRIEAFQKCIEERDAVAAERIVHPGFALVLVQPSPAVMPRKRWLEVLPAYVVHEYGVEERFIDVDGDVAAVLQRVWTRATVADQDRSGTFVISDVWRRSPDGWQIWRRHSTPFEAGRMPGA
jgi:uncharacterized protein DUF4440